MLYTSRASETALAEIHALLSLQPVIPSRDEWRRHRLKVSAARALDLGDLEILKTLGVDLDRYDSRDYSRTQPIGEAAFFLGADGLLVPSARAPGVNFVAFMERLGPSDVEAVETGAQAVDWGAWRRARRTTAERQPTREGPRVRSVRRPRASLSALRAGECAVHRQQRHPQIGLRPQQRHVIVHDIGAVFEIIGFGATQLAEPAIGAGELTQRPVEMDDLAFEIFRPAVVEIESARRDGQDRIEQ